MRLLFHIRVSAGALPAESIILVHFYQVWLPAVKAKGLEISGTFSRRQGHMYMDMSFTNKALQHMTDFAVQFNKNRSVTTVEMLMFTSDVGFMQVISLNAGSGHLA